MIAHRTLSRALLAIAAVVTTGCGGGTGGSDKAAPPTAASHPVESQPAASPSPASLADVNISDSPGSRVFCNAVREVAASSQLHDAVTGGGYALGSGDAALLSADAGVISSTSKGAPGALTDEGAALAAAANFSDNFVSAADAQEVLLHAGNLLAVCTRSRISPPA